MNANKTENYGFFAAEDAKDWTESTESNRIHSENPVHSVENRPDVGLPRRSLGEGGWLSTLCQLLFIFATGRIRPTADVVNLVHASILL